MMPGQARSPLQRGASSGADTSRSMPHHQHQYTWDIHVNGGLGQIEITNESSIL